MTARAQKIVFGAYTVSSTIGTVVGYAAAADDLKITELGTSETQTQPGGGTVQRMITNPGKSASGTLVLTKAAASSTYQTGYIGQILMITNNGDGSTRPYCVESWDEAPETDTGRRIATFTAVSEDSMVDAYLAGPVDPDTGTASNYVCRGLFGYVSAPDSAVDVSTIRLVSATASTGISVFTMGNSFRLIVPQSASTGFVVTFHYVENNTEHDYVWDVGSAIASVAELDGLQVVLTPQELA